LSSLTIFVRHERVLALLVLLSAGTDTMARIRHPLRIIWNLSRTHARKNFPGPCVFGAYSLMPDQLKSK
jgi:hypothetical protein